MEMAPAPNGFRHLESHKTMPGDQDAVDASGWVQVRTLRRARYLSQNDLKLDPSAKMDLMNLPGELRNQIYGHILRHDKQEGCQANTNLLQVSKQVLRESSGIFLNEFTPTIAVGTSSQLKDVKADFKFSTQDFPLNRWPEIDDMTIRCLCKFEYINLLLVGEDRSDLTDGRVWLHAAATSQLASMILRSIVETLSGLKRLKIILADDAEQRILDSVMAQIWPFVLRDSRRPAGPNRSPTRIAHSGMKRETINTILAGWTSEAALPNVSQCRLQSSTVRALFHTYTLAHSSPEEAAKIKQDMDSRDDEIQHDIGSAMFDREIPLATDKLLVKYDNLLHTEHFTFHDGEDRIYFKDYRKRRGCKCAYQKCPPSHYD